MKRVGILILSAVVILILSVSCDKTKKYLAEEQVLIQDYLSKSDLEFELKPSGLYYHEVVAGTGRVPVKFDTAYIKYSGKFLDGRTFDSNVGSANYLEVLVGSLGLIEGFAEGISYMTEGGKSILLVPSPLGYGPGGSYPYIPGFTPLIFEVELSIVKAGPSK